MHVVLAIAAGSLLGLLPRRPLEITVAVLFAAGAVLPLRGRRGHDQDGHAGLGGRPAGFWTVAATSFFTVILIAEFGDLTQIATVILAARYHDPVSVGLGALLGLWTVATLAIADGRGLLKIIPVTWISRAAAVVVMLVLAGFSLAALT